MIVGLTAGVFDVLHYGYFELFRDARSVCDRLVVAIHEDPSLERPWKAQPVHTVAERTINLLAIRYIDAVIPYATEADLAELVRQQDVDVRIVGSDYAGKEADIVGPGRRIHIHQRTHRFSATFTRREMCRLQAEADARQNGPA